MVTAPGSCEGTQPDNGTGPTPPPTRNQTNKPQPKTNTMNIKTAQAKANREKPTTGQHRFTWGDPFGNAQNDHFSQIGRCNCGAEVMVSNHGEALHTMKQHRQPGQQPPRTGYYLPDTGRTGANIASALMMLRQHPKVDRLLNEEDGHRYTREEIEGAMKEQTIYKIK